MRVLREHEGVFYCLLEESYIVPATECIVNVWMKVFVFSYDFKTKLPLQKDYFGEEAINREIFFSWMLQMVTEAAKLVQCLSPQM